MHTAHLPSVYVVMITTRCQYWGVGPQVTKFEQGSSGDHQMSVSGEGIGAQFWCLGMERVGEEGRCPGLMSGGGRCPGLCLWERVCVGGRGGGTLPIPWCMWFTYPPPHGQKDICENTTFPQLHLWAITRRHFSRMPTGHLSGSTSYIVNKFEHVWVDPCGVRSNLMRFEHVGGGLGPRMVGTPL